MNVNKNTSIGNTTDALRVLLLGDETSIGLVLRAWDERRHVECEDLVAPPAQHFRCAANTDEACEAPMTPAAGECDTAEHHAEIRRELANIRRYRRAAKRRTLRTADVEMVARFGCDGRGEWAREQMTVARESREAKRDLWAETAEDDWADIDMGMFDVPMVEQESDRIMPDMLRELSEEGPATAYEIAIRHRVSEQVARNALRKASRRSNRLVRYCPILDQWTITREGVEQVEVRARVVASIRGEEHTHLLLPGELEAA